jgi:tRNA pseudouridine13 synthase
MNERPHEPPLMSGDLPGTSGSIGPEPEHFVVEEIPLYEPSGSGEHLYVQVEKRLMTTPDLVRRIAEAAGVESRDIGYAGLKDRQAVTRQWLSLPAKASSPEAWQLPSGVSVLRVSRHANKLRTGHLGGNRFRITLVGVVEAAASNAHAILARLAEHGLPNYFGAQRYGRGAENLARARHWLAQGGRARLPAFLLKLYPSVLQSEVFNRYLTLRVSEGLEQLFQGEVVRLQHSSASFVVEDLERERPRFAAREIRLTGPMLGPKMRPATGRPLELEAEAARAAGCEGTVLETLARFAPGTRRDLVVYPEHVELQESDGQLVVAFTLASGSYATMLVRELTRSPFLAEGQPEEMS